MHGKTNLAELIRDMMPTLQPGTYCFCNWPHERTPDIRVLGSFREVEGWTVIVEESIALQHGLQPVFRAAWITLEVHSDLLAVGFLAAVAQVLAKAGIACNVVSGIHHDHLFVPMEQGGKAIDALARYSDSGVDNE